MTINKLIDLPAALARRVAPRLGRAHSGQMLNNLIGRSLGAYEIREQLGAGGMANVYKAYHPALRRDVAIKILAPHLVGDPLCRARFQREAHTIARLEHRAILPIYDVGEVHGLSYLVMRYVEGGTLADLIGARPLPLDRAVQLIGQVAEALACAHRQGVVHRDIKPANILIDRDGNALLADFGIAKLVEETRQLTSTGARLGTALYMAPEQVLGHSIDARTDIYALGVVLYEALTGVCPFMADELLALALMHVHGPLRPPSLLNPAIPPALDRAIAWALAKNPAERFRSAESMGAALRKALASESGAHGSRCAHCGASLRPGGSFCGACGQPRQTAWQPLAV
jgi:eukaryotic-like serine/threonine-protein kinase